jgi:hypothetical protein
MLSVCDLPPALLLPLEPLQPANPAAKQAKISSPAAAYPRRLPNRGHLLCSGAACCASSKSKMTSDAAIHSNTPGTRSHGRGSLKGTNCESAVVSVALQEAPTVVDTAPAGVHVNALPSAVVPFINCTVPLGPALLLLLDDTVAVRVTLPPDATLVGLDTTADVVVAFVIVTASVLLLALELKLLFASAVYAAEML